MGASRRVPGCTPGCLRTAGAPTQAAEGRRAEAPSRAAHGADSPPASRAQLPAPSSPRPPRSPLRSSPRGDGKLRRDRPDPLALTSLLRSSSSRECLPAAVPGGTQGSAGHGVAAPRACGGATWAGSSPGRPRQPREPQGRRRAGRGRDGLQTLSPGGAAHGASTLGLHTLQRRSSGAQLTRARGLASNSSYPPLPTSPTSPRFWARSSLRQGFRPGTFGKLPALPAELSANSERPSLSGAVCKLPTLSERTLPTSQFRNPKAARETLRGHKYYSSKVRGKCANADVTMHPPERCSPGLSAPGAFQQLSPVTGDYGLNHLPDGQLESMP